VTRRFTQSRPTRTAQPALSEAWSTSADRPAQGQCRRTNNEISRELLVSIATVKAYVSRVLTKLELTNRVQVALLVQDADLTEPSP
jgi:hypothetical protein